MDRDCAILKMSKDGRKGSGSRDLTWVMIPKEENCAIEKGMDLEDLSCILLFLLRLDRVCVWLAVGELCGRPKCDSILINHIYDPKEVPQSVTTTL